MCELAHTGLGTIGPNTIFPPRTVLSWDAPPAKQPPHAAASHRHEQNRQCNCSCKHCDYCCERKDVHNAIRKCEKHAFPLDGKSPSHCWPGKVKQSEATLGVRPSPLCTRRAEHFFEALTEFPGPGSFFGQGPQPLWRLVYLRQKFAC